MPQNPFAMAVPKDEKKAPNQVFGGPSLFDMPAYNSGSAKNWENTPAAQLKIVGQTDEGAEEQDPEAKPEKLLESS